MMRGEPVTCRRGCLDPYCRETDAGTCSRARSLASFLYYFRMLAALVLGTAFSFMAWHNNAVGDSPEKVTDQQPYHFSDTADYVRITRVDRNSGGADRAIVTVVIEPGYHINANPASMDSLIPTTPKITKLTPLRVIYPEPVHFKPKFSNDVLDVYEGSIKIIVEFSPGDLAREARLVGTLTAQACTEDICLPPADMELPK